MYDMREFFSGTENLAPGIHLFIFSVYINQFLSCPVHKKTLKNQQKSPQKKTL